MALWLTVLTVQHCTATSRFADASMCEVTRNKPLTVVKSMACNVVLGMNEQHQAVTRKLLCFTGEEERWLYTTKPDMVKTSIVSSQCVCLYTHPWHQTESLLLHTHTLHL